MVLLLVVVIIILGTPVLVIAPVAFLLDLPPGAIPASTIAVHRHASGFDRLESMHDETRTSARISRLAVVEAAAGRFSIKLKAK